MPNDVTTDKDHPRLEAIDYLRGMFALSVAVYHYATWSDIPLHWFPAQVLSKLGIYAVCAFYVISGLSFGYVYEKIKLDGRNLSSFWVKRYFRLVPLYAVVCVSTICIAYARGKEGYSLSTILNNITLLFGVTDPDDYIPVGGWSIGNEFSFYLIFPVLILVRRAGRLGAIGLAMFALFMSLLYSFHMLDGEETLSSQWPTYINPLNQVPFFIGGLLIAPTIHWGKSISPHSLVRMLTLLCLAFALIPIDSPIAMVTGYRRILLSAITVSACAVAFWCPKTKFVTLNRILSLLGLCSYSIYLIHPLVYNVCWKITNILAVPTLQVPVAFAVTLFVARLSYLFIEKPMIGIGKVVATQLAPKPKPEYRLAERADT
ncbi:Acyltransferase family protein [Stieleria neptunia]|uniref:Acyltransferase family protein n=1 Tax=Stieleria neptunia TaxID=2527979 RepID=A0A518HTP2_9BACT|nr:acyltransferase [Stieleria neptunia]QDV44206.1 Acyltransferase family protein [Stieleria neptunia]